MSIRRLLALPLVCMVACSSGTDEQREPPPVKDTAFGDMVGTMDKARDVEDKAMERKDEMDRALREAEGDH